MILTPKSSAADPTTSQEKLRKLAAHGDAEVRRRVAANSSTPSDVLVQLKFNHPLEVAGNPATPNEVLEELTQSKTVAIQIAVAGNRATPTSVLERMVTVRGSDEDVLLAIASNENASPEALKLLSGGTIVKPGSPNFYPARLAVATNPSTPTTVRAGLFASDDLREAILHTRPKESTETRVKLASSVSGTPRVREFLASDPAEEVRRAVAANPATEPGLLEKLAKDPSPNVANVALARIADSESKLRELAGSNDKLVLAALTRNPKASDTMKPELARRNVDSDDLSVLGKLGRDVETPPDILIKLATHTNAGLRKVVAANPATPIEALTRLAKDVDGAVRATVVSPSPTNGLSDPLGLPFDRMGRWASGTHGSSRSDATGERSFPLEIQVALSTDVEPAVRAALAASHTTQSQLLVRLASDEATVVVAAAAANPNTPGSALEEISSRQLGKLNEWCARVASGSRSYHAPAFGGTSSDLREVYGLLVLVMRGPSVPADTVTQVWQSIQSVYEQSLSYSFRISSGDKGLIDSGTQQVCGAVAAIESAPADILGSVATFVQQHYRFKGDPDRGDRSAEGTRERILDAIVRNPATSGSTLNSLSNGSWVARRTTTRSEREDGRTTTWAVWDHAATEAAKLDKTRHVAQVVSSRAWKSAGDSADRVSFASSSSTPVELLAELAKDADTRVRAAVAGNPSISPPVFAELARDHAESVRLAAASSIHPDSELAKHERDWRQHRETLYAEAFESLSGDPEVTVREAVAANGKIAWSILSEQTLERLSLDPDMRVAVALIRGFLSDRPDRHEQHWGSSANLSIQALERLIAVGGVEFWKALANDFHTPQTALSLLHKKGDRDLERAIVGHHNVSVGVLAEIAQHGDSEVLAKFGGYRYSSTGEDPARHPEVTRRLAANPATPIDLLAGLARSEDDDTCRLALSNPRFPTATLVEYAASDDARMIQLAASTGNQSALDSIAANPNASRDLLVALAQGGNQAVRDALLLNKSTPPDILLMLIEADSSQ